MIFFDPVGRRWWLRLPLGGAKAPLQLGFKSGRLDALYWRGAIWRRYESGGWLKMTISRG